MKNKTDVVLIYPGFFRDSCKHSLSSNGEGGKDGGRRTGVGRGGGRFGEV